MLSEVQANLNAGSCWKQMGVPLHSGLAHRHRRQVKLVKQSPAASVSAAFRVLSRNDTASKYSSIYTKSRLQAYQANYLHTSNAVKASKFLYTKSRLLLHEANYLHTSAPL